MFACVAVHREHVQRFADARLNGHAAPRRQHRSHQVGRAQRCVPREQAHCFMPFPCPAGRAASAQSLLLPPCAGLDSIALGWMQPVFDGLRKWFGVRSRSSASSALLPLSKRLVSWLTRAFSLLIVVLLFISTSTSLIRSACRGTAAARSRCSRPSVSSWVRPFLFCPHPHRLAHLLRSSLPRLGMRTSCLCIARNLASWSVVRRYSLLTVFSLCPVWSTGAILLVTILQRDLLMYIGIKLGVSLTPSVRSVSLRVSWPWSASTACRALI